MTEDVLDKLVAHWRKQARLLTQAGKDGGVSRKQADRCRAKAHTLRYCAKKLASMKWK